MTKESIPDIQRYSVDGWGCEIDQVNDGSWVRYDDHVAAVELMRSEVQQLGIKRNDRADELWVRHLKASDILDLQSLMVLLAGRDKEEREAAFKGILEIMNPVVVGVRSMEAIKPSDVIWEAIEDRNWSAENFVDYLVFYTSWSGSSTLVAKELLSCLLSGTKRIDDHAASMLSFGFGCPAKYWLDIQAAYDKAKGEGQ